MFGVRWALLASLMASSAGVARGTAAASPKTAAMLSSIDDGDTGCAKVGIDDVSEGFNEVNEAAVAAAEGAADEADDYYPKLGPLRRYYEDAGAKAAREEAEKKAEKAEKAQRRWWGWTDHVRDVSDKPEGKYPNTFLKYGRYCGPGPGLNADCSLPDEITPIDDVDGFCASHDRGYCLCGFTALKAGQLPPKEVPAGNINAGADDSGCKKLPNSVMLAIRSRMGAGLVARRLRQHYARFFDDETDQISASKVMVGCIHEADKEFVANCRRLRDKAELPKWWDGLTRWKYRTMVNVFEKNLKQDEKILAALEETQRRVEAKNEDR